MIESHHMSNLCNSSNSCEGQFSSTCGSDVAVSTNALEIFFCQKRIKHTVKDAGVQSHYFYIWVCSSDSWQAKRKKSVCENSLLRDVSRYSKLMVGFVTIASVNLFILKLCQKLYRTNQYSQQNSSATCTLRELRELFWRQNRKKMMGFKRLLLR
jgi:hypothetical protein